MERYGADWTYDTLVRCRKFYQAYANASIVATPLPQLENQSEAPDSEEVTNSGVCFAIFAIFTGQNTPSTQVQGTITFVAGQLNHGLSFPTKGEQT